MGGGGGGGVARFLAGRAHRSRARWRSRGRRSLGSHSRPGRARLSRIYAVGRTTGAVISAPNSRLAMTTCERRIDAGTGSTPTLSRTRPPGRRAPQMRGACTGWSPRFRKTRYARSVGARSYSLSRLALGRAHVHERGALARAVSRIISLPASPSPLHDGAVLVRRVFDNLSSPS